MSRTIFLVTHVISVYFVYYIFFKFFKIVFESVQKTKFKRLKVVWKIIKRVFEIKNYDYHLKIKKTHTKDKQQKRQSSKNTNM